MADWQKGTQKKSENLKSLDDLKPAYLYLSKSSSILDDTIEKYRKFLKGKINTEVDFKIFYADDDLDETELVNFHSTPSFFSEKKVAVIKKPGESQRAIGQDPGKPAGKYPKR